MMSSNLAIFEKTLIGNVRYNLKFVIKRLPDFVDIVSFIIYHMTVTLFSEITHVIKII